MSTFRNPIIQKASTVVPVDLPTEGDITLNLERQLTAKENTLGVSTDSTDKISHLVRNFPQSCKHIQLAKILQDLGVGLYQQRVVVAVAIFAMHQ